VVYDGNVSNIRINYIAAGSICSILQLSEAEAGKQRKTSFKNIREMSSLLVRTSSHFLTVSKYCIANRIKQSDVG
jgi:hypothetical protein